MGENGKILALDRRRAGGWPAGERFMKQGRATLAALGCWLATGLSVAEVEPRSGEYDVLGRQYGDQSFPRLAMGPAGGYLVWQDNNLDGEGPGIGAVALDREFRAVRGAFRVNRHGAGGQRSPVLALLPGGGAAFAWESDGEIWLRIAGGDGIFARPEIRANLWARGTQRDPAIAALDGGRIVVVWGSEGQDGDMQGVFGSLFDARGVRLGAEFRINQRFELNQRTPAVAALDRDRFVVSWISEERLDVPDAGVVGGERYQVGVYGRIFDADGRGETDESYWGVPELIDANPALTKVPGGFLVLTSGRQARELAGSTARPAAGWDVYGRFVDDSGRPQGARFRINEHVPNHQMIPSATTLDGAALVVWNSTGQDGHREGVFGRLVRPQAPLGSAPEFAINVQSRYRQMLPTVAAADSRALVVWTGYGGGPDSFDLKGRRYAAGEPDQSSSLDAPFVYGAGFETLRASWPAIDGVARYEVYLGDAAPVVADTNHQVFADLPAGTRHAVSFAGVYPDGTRTGRSASGYAVTWGGDGNGDGLPDDWQREHWGAALASWPPLHRDSDGDGADNYHELLAGTNPVDPASVLRLEWVSSGLGLRLRWNTRAGGFYQAQVSTDLRVWTDAGTPRLAVDAADSIAVGRELGNAVYRVLRVK